MKNWLCWVLFLFVGITLLNNCLQNRTYKDLKKKQSFLDQLRFAYSSGDTLKWPKPVLDPSVTVFSEIGHLPEVEFPADNPYSEEKASLGRTLFYDPRLSGSNQIACASCHDPELGWTDNRRLSFGHDRQLGRRNAMTIMNVAYAKSMFWDGRSQSLEDQVKMPIEDLSEMSEHIDIATEKIIKVKGYEILFEKAFGDKKITKDRIAKAIATFERTVVSPQSRFDQFIDGEKDALTDDEVMGLHLFRTKAQCMNCHNSGYFSNNLFENDGTSLLSSDDEDLGRYLITKKSVDVGKFRVPTLREVVKTAPWMHRGSFNTLSEVINFYNMGNPESYKNRSTLFEGKQLISEKSDMLKLLELTKEEMLQLEAFLGTLSTPTARPLPPKLPK